jgi:hypothetical protein
VCHAAENNFINERSKDVFKDGNVGKDYPFSFSLSPYKAVDFFTYDDGKLSLTGVIDNQEYQALVRKTFMRVFAMKLNDYYKANPSVYPVKMTSAEFSLFDKGECSDNLEEKWISHLNID